MRRIPQPISELQFPSPPDEVREVADALIKTLGDNLTALLWHGSWARGEQTPESDHDLIVVLKQLDEGVLASMSKAFEGRSLWSTYVKTEEELRQYPIAGRLQFHHGFVALYGDIEPPLVTTEGLLEELRRIATDVAHEARYRIIHGRGRELRGLDAEHARIRTARWLYYQTKMLFLALKTREVLQAAPYPATRAELRTRLTDPDEIAVIDTIEHWVNLKPEYERDFTPLGLLLDRVVRKLIHELDSGSAQ
jgi:predicted nucleotidyltransferase